MRIELEPDELDELLHIGDTALGDLRVEVRRTATRAYREKLALRREQLARAWRSSERPRARR